MLGAALKLGINSDSLRQNETDFYFPPGIWCNVYVPSEPCKIFTDGTNVTLSSKAYDFYVHLRDGYIIPMQDATSLGVLSTTDLQQYPTDFHILGTPGALGMTWYAAGSFVNDLGNETQANIARNYN